MTREEAIKEAYGIPVNKKQHEALQILIPELAESEDERILNGLIASIKDQIRCGGEYYFGMPLKDILDWLEKQKNKMTAEEYESSELFQLKLKTKYANGYQDALAQKEQKPANNYLEWRNIVYYVLKEWLGIGQYMDMAPFNDIVKTLQERYSLSKPAEWSEEDEEMLSGFLHKLEVCDLLSNKENAWIVRKLKSLRPQPQAEWSEEDEKMLKCCLIAINHYEKTCNIGNHLPTKFNIDGYLASVDKVKSWFKYLRPSWKPSMEQICMVTCVCNNLHMQNSPDAEGMDELLKQLEKLYWNTPDVEEKKT